MSDDNLVLNLRIDLLQALASLEAGGRAGKDFDQVILQLVTDIHALEKQMAESGSVIQQVLGAKLTSNIDTTRQSIELLKTGFRELVASGRSLEDIGNTFTKIKDRGVIEGSFGEAFAKEIKAGVGTALSELKKEFSEINRELAKSAEQMVPVTSRADQWRASIDRVKDSLKEIMSSGKSLDDAVGTLGERSKLTEEFSPKQISQAGKEIRNEIVQIERAFKAASRGAEEFREAGKKGFGDPLTAAQIFRGNVDALKVQMADLQKISGLSLKDIEQGFKNANQVSKEFAPSQISGAASELRKEQEEYNKELAKAKELQIPLIANTDKWVAGVARAKDELRAALVAGKTLADATAAFQDKNKTTDAFAPGQISQASKELRAEISQIEKALQAASREVAKFREEGKRGFGDPQTAAQLFRINVDAIKTQMQELQRVSGLSLKDIEQGFRAANQVSKEFTSGQITRAANELRSLGTAAKEVSTSMSALDQISTVFFGTTLANLAMNAIRRVIGGLDELAKRGIAVSRSFFILSTSVRGWQRLGSDVTIAEVNAQIEKLSETFSFFTQRQLREGVGMILLLTRNLQLTKEEIFRLTEATATLAIVTGKDFGEEGMLVARAIASGYTEALQRAGIEASRTTIQTEALKHGIDKAFLAMTQAERATVTLGLVLDQVGNIEEDVAQFEETLAGAYAKTTSEIQTQADTIGSILTPAWVIGTTIIGKALAFLVDAYRGAALVLGVVFINPMVSGLLAISKAFHDLRNGIEVDLESIKKDYAFFFVDFAKSWTETLSGVGDNVFTDLFGDDVGMFAPDIGELDTDDMEKEIESLKNKLGDILFDFSNGIEDIWTDFQRKLEDIDIDELRKLADLEEDNQEKIAEIGREYQDKLAEAQRKFREKEIQAEIDYQEKMRQLREKFLFDLEDALRERDAKQVLRLIREYNLRAEQMGREEQIASDERARAFQLELQQIAEQRDIKLRELEIENELKRKEIAEDADERREDAGRRLNQELEDNKLQFDRRMEQLRAALSEEELAWLDHALALIDIANFTFESLAAIWGQMFAFLKDANKQLPWGGSGNPWNSGGGGTKNQQKSPKNIINFAEGGTMFANTPTNVQFGEKGWEMATFTPLGRMGRNQNKVFGDIPGGMGGGRVRIEVLMEAGLVGRIIDSTLGEMSDIIVRNT